VKLRGAGGRGIGAAGTEAMVPKTGRIRRVMRPGRCLVAAALGPVLAAGTSLVAVTVVAAGIGAASVAAAGPAHAATLPTVLFVLVNGEGSAPEQSLLPTSQYTTATATPAQLAAMSQSTFDSYAAVVIGDSSPGSTCSATVPSTSTLGSQWEPWVTGNVAVLGTAPEQAAQDAGSGQSGADALITGSVEYAAAGYGQSAQTGTGLYLSLNCAYKTSPAGTVVSLLNGVPGVAADPITVQGGMSCTDSGTVNQWGTGSAGTFSGFTSADLASGVSGSWPSPSCPMWEAFDSWPANFSPAAFDASSNSDATANFTASDGVTGQPYVLLGSPAPSQNALALTPSTGGQAPMGRYGVDGNAADPGLTQASAGDPVNTESGDFTQDDTDVSIPTFGPALEFDRTYDAQLAQQQEQTGTPGPMGYGWTDNWATTLSTSSPIPGDIYALDGLAGAVNSGEGLTEYAGNGQAPGSVPLGHPGGVLASGANVYYADTQGNRVEEIAGSTGVQYGVQMTKGDVYTIAGSYTGQYGGWANYPAPGTAGTSALLNQPEGLAMNAAGDLFIADTGGQQVDELTPSGTLGTAGTLTTIAGNGSYSAGPDGEAATGSELHDPTAVAVDPAGDVFIADSANNRIQEVFHSGGKSYGQSMTAGDVYTVAGSATGTAGTGSNGQASDGSLLKDPESVTADSAGDLYIADTGNNRIEEVAAAAGKQWGIQMAADAIYTVLGSATGAAGNHMPTSTLLTAPDGVLVTSSNALYITDTGNNMVQFVPRAAGTFWGQSMADGGLYDIAGSSAGTAGGTGNGGAGISALLDGPTAVALDSSGDLYIADADNNEIRELSAATEDIALTAGDGQDLASAGNGGPAVNGQLIEPGGEIADSHGDIYVTDSQNNRVQEIAAYTHTQWGIPMTGGEVYTIAGSATGVAGNSGDGGAATAALLDDPQGLAFDPSGNLLIADFGNNQIRAVDAQAGTNTIYGQSMTANDIYTIAGQTSGASGTAGDGGPAASGYLYRPQAVAVDAKGDVYIADKDNNRVQEIQAAGGISWGQTMKAGDIYTVAGSATGAAGSSGDGGPATSATLGPEGVAVDAAGDLIIADTSGEQVRMVPVAAGTYYGQSMKADYIYTLAGSTAGTGGSSGDGGPAVDSELYTPIGIALDPAGDIYIADAANDRIQEIAATSGIQWANLMNPDYIYTVAGNGTSTGLPGDGGSAYLATIYFAASTGTDNYGDLYIGDQSGGQLREVTSATPATIAPAPGLTSALYPAPGSTINGDTYQAGITVTQPGGAQVTFYPPTSGSCALPLEPTGSYCVQPQFQTATLTTNGTSWTFSPAPGSDTYTYSAALGTLITITDPAGTQTVASNYPAPGAATSTTSGTWPATSTAITCPSTATSCQAIISASGRALVIGSNASGQVTSITDPMGRRWTYGYSGDDLSSASDPMGNTTTYTYNTTNSNPLLDADLLTITGPNAQPGYSGPDADLGADTVNVYNPVGQVTQQTDPMGNITTFNYCPVSAPDGCLNAATGDGLVEVDTNGSSTINYYDQGVLAATADWTGSVSTGSLISETDSTPDTTLDGTAAAGTLLDTNTTDGDANTTSYQYDAGNLTQVTAPSGGTTPTGTEVTTSGYPTATAQDTPDLESDNCSSTAEATATCSNNPGPPPVSSGGTITSPASAPPLGLTWNLYDTDGNRLYSTTGVYSPSGSYEYSQTTYQLFKGNSVTLNSSNVSCTYTPPTSFLPCATINADAVVTQLQYDPQGDLISSANPDGNSGGQLATTSYANDADGEQTSTVSPDGNLSGANAGNYTTTTAYNADGEKISVTQGDGTGYTDTPRTTAYGYDADGNQTSATDARGYSSISTYNADDQETLVTNPDGDSTLTCYDSQGDVTETVPPVGVAANNLTSASCPSQAAFLPDFKPTTEPPLASDATMYAYDADGNQTAIYSPAPPGQTGYETTTSTYDGDDNLISTTAPATSNSTGAPDQVTVNTYTSTGQLASQTSGYGTPATSTLSYCYDPNGDQTSQVYPDGNTSGVAPCETSSPWSVSSTSDPTQAAYQTTYSHDSLGELVSTTTPATTAAPDGAMTTTTYDPDGNQLTSTDPDGVTTTWTYSPVGSPTTVSYSGSSTHPVSYTYDADGQLTGMTDGTGTSSYSYDSFGELISAEDGAGQTVGYAYDPDRDVTGITYPLPSAATWASTDTVTYGYDHADRLTSLTDFNGHQLAISNTTDGLPSSIALGSTGDTIIKTYAPTDTPSAIALTSGGGTDLQQFSYTDSPAGTMLSECDAGSCTTPTVSYTYDTDGRVTSMAPGTGVTVSYGFDASGNLTTLPTGATATYDHAGELTSSALSGTATDYTYNVDGEQLSSTQGSTTVTSGTWNGARQMLTYSDPAASMSAVTYNGAGERANATFTPAGGPATAQDYVWADTASSVPQLLMDSSNAYIYMGGPAPAEQVNLATGAINYLSTDALDSVRGVVSSSGALTAATSYDAWGNPASSGGLTSYTPFGFAGGYTDPDGLIYLINRYYDPSTGQFISPDPDLAQTSEPYAYALGNPVGYTDPTGTLPSPFNWRIKGGIRNNVRDKWWYWLPGGLTVADNECGEDGCTPDDEIRVGFIILPYANNKPAGGKSRIEYFYRRVINGGILEKPRLYIYELCDTPGALSECTEPADPKEVILDEQKQAYSGYTQVWANLWMNGNSIAHAIELAAWDPAAWPAPMWLTNGFRTAWAYCNKTNNKCNYPK
jgi:RHS repeat-associated protein